MAEREGLGGGPVRPSGAASGVLRPLGGARITGGFWAARRSVNTLVSLASGPARLEAAGNLANLRRAAEGSGGFRGDFQFQDSDVYKWLEAASWELADAEPSESHARLADAVDEIVTLVEHAQDDDGYLQTYYQLGGGARWTELGWGHELYCAGHLIQAAIAHHRATGDARLLAVACRFADHIDSIFGPGRQVDGVCGHPQVETALVELYRETGERRFLDLAGYFIDRRGTGALAAGADRGHDRDPGPAFWQDHVPVREADAVAGHAVRQLYLLAGAADVAVETGDPELHEATVRLWRDMAETKTYLTGGVGSRYDWEAFGDPYELPADRAYAETCAAIGSIQFSWRMALATGEARYSDLVERTLFNGFLSGVGFAGDRWLYVNPLHRRSVTSVRAGDQTMARTPWFRCACCPPNAMRLLASLPYYVASASERGVQLHQYASGAYRHGEIEIAVATDYPWDGRIVVTIVRTPERDWELALRIPGWCERWAVAGADVAAEDGWVRLGKTWRAGETVELELVIAPRLTRPHPKIDAVRGCVAIEYGPLVYCMESVDQPAGTDLDDLAVVERAPLVAQWRADLLGGIVAVTATADVLVGERWPREVTAVPYALWANREPGAMRVWLPARRQLNPTQQLSRLNPPQPIDGM